MNHPPPAKMTYTQGAENLVPDSAARWRSIRKNFIQSKASHQEKQSKIQMQNEITTHAYSQKKKGTQANRAKAIIILILT